MWYTSYLDIRTACRLLLHSCVCAAFGWSWVSVSVHTGHSTNLIFTKIISTKYYYYYLLQLKFNSMVKSRRMSWAGHVARMGKGRGVHRVLVGKPERKRPLGRPRRRWEDNIKMDLQKVGGSCGDWIELAQDREWWRALVGKVRNLRVPKMRGISWLAAEPVSFSRRTLLHGVSKWFFPLPPDIWLCKEFKQLYFWHPFQFINL